MKGKYIDKMAQLALEHPDLDVSDIYNMLMRAIPKDDVDFVSAWYALMLTVAREARNAPKNIQLLIQNS